MEEIDSVLSYSSVRQNVTHPHSIEIPCFSVEATVTFQENKIKGINGLGKETS